MKIESLQNQTVKNLVRLQSKKDRDATGRFLVEGRHMIEEAEKAGLLQTVYQLEDLPPIASVPAVFCSQAVLNKISVQKSDARYIGLCSKPEQPEAARSRLLLLDRVQDPGNLGTLIRSAYAFGLEGVICSSGCADPYSPKALQSSQGAAFHLPVSSEDLLQTIQDLHSRDIPVYGAALHQDSAELHTLPVPESFALIIGNEGQGIDASILEQCTRTVFIEMQQFESLNAAVAGSILMYHFQFSHR